MDQLFVSRQPAPPSAPVTLWQNVTIASRQLQHTDMEYHPYAPPTHTITSPPTTPMTPGPLTPHHVGVFPMCRGDHHISAHHGSGMTSYPNIHNNVPTLSHSTWPPEYRLYALCQELQRYSTTQQGVGENKLYWDQFCMEYFHEMAVLVIQTDSGRYTLHGSLIKWYFKTIVCSGALRFNMILGRMISQTYHQNVQRIECPEAVQELDYELAHHIKVCCRGHLVIDFTMEEKPHITSWMFHIQNHEELIPRFCMQTATIDATLSNNLTCQGLPSATHNVLIQLNGITDGNMITGEGHPAAKTSPPKLIQAVPNAPAVHWEPHPPQELISLQVSGTDTILTHLPPPLTDPQPIQHSPQTTSSLPCFSTSSLPTSPVLIKSNGSSNGSSCSLISNSNHTSVPPGGKVTTTCGGGGGGGGAAKKATPPVINKKSQLVMIATDPTYFTEDMVHGGDERRITRIDNNKQATPPSLSIATPGSTTSEPVTTPTSQLANENAAFTWIENVPTSTNDWKREQR